MTDLRIVDAPVLLQESITDDVKMPTGGLGNYAISLGDIVWYVVQKEQLASKNYVDTSSKGVQYKLDTHIADKTNPHQVTKAQVGLGNVDNTADIDKPVSNAVSSAIITATTDMATKAYVNSKDGDLTTLTTTDKTSLVKAINEVVSVKADKATTLAGYGISDAYTKSEIDTNYNGVKTLYEKNVEAGAGANGWDANLVAYGEITQKQINDGLESIAQLLTIKNPRNGMRVYVKSYHAGLNKGGGTFVYDATKTNVNDGIVINGWVRTNFEIVYPEMFGAIADGTLHPVQEWTVAGSNPYYKDLAAIQVDYPHVTDLTDSIDWAAVVKAFGVSNAVNFGDDKNHYVINKIIQPNSNQRIIGNFAAIRQTKGNTQIFDPSNKTNVRISGIKFIGMGVTDFNNSPGSRSDGVYAFQAKGLTVENCLFKGLSHSALTCTESENVKFVNNKVVGLGASNLTAVTSHSNVGVVIDRKCNNAIVENNNITDTAMGIQTGSLCENVKLHKNEIKNITGQHAIYAGAAQTNLLIDGNQIQSTSLAGIKVQTYDVEAKETTNVTVANNQINDVGGDGILIDNTTASPAYLSVNVNIIGNNVKNAGQDGINARYVKRGLIANNIVDTTRREGITYSGGIDVKVDNNTVSKAGNNGIIEIFASTRCIVSNNKIIDPSVNNTTSQKYGIIIVSNATALTLHNNTIVDTQSKMQYGIFVENGDVATMTVTSNKVSGATDAGLRKVATTTAFKYYANNVFEGRLGATIGVDSVPYQIGNTGRTFFAAAMPTSGNFLKGDYVTNNAPSISANSVVVGWLRLTNGSNHVLNTDWVAIKQSTV